MPPEDIKCANHEKNHLIRAITCSPKSHFKFFEEKQLQGSINVSEGEICIHRSHPLDFSTTTAWTKIVCARHTMNMIPWVKAYDVVFQNSEIYFHLLLHPIASW